MQLAQDATSAWLTQIKDQRHNLLRICAKQGVFRLRHASYSMTKPDPRLFSRLSRIEGQVRGVARMLEDRRYCIDVLNQIQAIKAALRRVEEQILKAHAETCVTEAIERGNPRDQRKKFSELVELLSRYAP